MAKYDFDQLIPRRGTNSVKWDEEPAADILPMWVADMDFRTAPCVVEALRRRVEHGVYGYATVPESYYGAVTSWFARRHGWAPGADWILPVTGVIPALSAILRALTRPGDRVLVLTPVYNHFFIAIDNSGCSAAECELTYGDNRYTVDFDALERRAADPAVKLMLLCNPHNPIGKVLTLEEELRLSDLAAQYDVRIFNDEIHAPFVFEGKHIPFPTISEQAALQSMTATSASKSFNIPGTKCAQVLLTNPADRDMWAVKAEWSEHQTATIGAIATTTAYNEGDLWFQDAFAYVRRNLALFDEQMRERFAGVGYIKPQGTYIAWLDFSPLGIDDPAAYFLEKAQVALTDGRSCGETGAGCVRVNIAMPYPLLVECLDRMYGALHADGLL